MRSVKVESDIREASAAACTDKPRFYYYDDFLGQTALPDKLGKNEDQKILDFITTIRESKHSKLVLTTREYILNQARRTYEKIGRESFENRNLHLRSRKIHAQEQGPNSLQPPLFFGTACRLLEGDTDQPRLHQTYRPSKLQPSTD